MTSASVQRLVGKVALVTGAARGIGASTAKRFADEGARLALTDIDLAGVQQIAADLRVAGCDALAWRMNVSDRGNVGVVLGEILSNFSRVDILVNNAAIGKPLAFLDVTDEDLRQVLDVNLDGVFRVAQEVARQMVRQGGGTIVNVGSLAAFTANERQAAYAAAKGAVDALTRVMAFELAPMGVTVNAVAPGPVDTELALKMLTPASRAARQERVPLGRLSRPDEIAATIAFLASRDASYLNGTTIIVDGGLLTGGIREPSSTGQEPNRR